MLEERQDAVAHAEEYVVAYFGFGRRCCSAEEIEPMVRYISEATAKAGTTVSRKLACDFWLHRHPGNRRGHSGFFTS